MGTVCITEGKTIAVVGIIQARVGSKRFPGKVLEKLGEHRIIDWVIRRASQSQLIDRLILAIPDTTDNDVLWANDWWEYGLDGTIRGPEDDVLARFMNVLKVEGGSHIVRICADNPFVDPHQIDRMIGHYFYEEHDYLWHKSDLSGEIMSARLLYEIDRRATLPEDREHVTKYIRDHAENYRYGEIETEGWNLTVDTPDDLDRLRRLVPPLTIESDITAIWSAYQSITG